jgi:NAD(P)-dependent dehydrogenase (short-subunit alcohol dehydrogenase family)
MAEDEAWEEDEDEMFPPVYDEPEPEPEPEPPAIAAAVAALCDDAELATVLRVLEALEEQKEVFLESKRFKKVRFYARKLNTTLQEKMYDGLSEQEYQKMHIKSRIESSIKDRMKARDRDKVEKAKLRAARMEQLQKLQGLQSADGQLALSAVPDGAVDTGPSAAMLAAGVGAQSSFAVKTGRRTLLTGRETTGAATGGGPARLEDSSTAAPGTGSVEDVDDTGADASQAEADEEDDHLYQERSCYLCKNWFTKLHHFYDQFCPQCAAVNWEKRHQTAEMHGRVALVTGGRVKIGYHVALKLLRCGATTIVTSRFPADAARRFAAEPDFEQWKTRVHCYGLDLRHTAGVESFCTHIAEKFGRLDALINNACQTIRRPAAYYQHMIAGEKEAANQEEAAVLRPLLANNIGWISQGTGRLAQVEAPEKHRDLTEDKADLAAGDAQEARASRAAELELRLHGDTASPTDGAGHDSAALSQAAVHAEDVSVKVGPRANANSAHTGSTEALTVISAQDANEVVLPEGVYDVNGQQLDTRRENSWLLKLGEIATVEAAEVLAINALAPFTLNSKLKPLLLAAVQSHAADGGEGNGKAFVVNVSAMEGKFYRFKTPNHPHTNMAKAALNMMTRTSADALKDEGIYMNSVDTGWINDENPLEKAAVNYCPRTATRLLSFPS